MKRKVSLMTVFLVTLIFGNLTIAQDMKTDRRRNVPEGCPKNAKLEVITRNSTTGVNMTQQLQSVFNSVPTITQFPVRGYGIKGPDRMFGDSFPLGNCKICAARLTTTITDEGGNNDSLLVFMSDPTEAWITTGNGGMNGNRLLYLNSYGTVGSNGRPKLWDSAGQGTKTLTLDLKEEGNISQTTGFTTNGISKLNNYIFNFSGTPYLDVVVWDDTKVDSMQLEIWR
jgi:hypothetical protein